LANEDEVTLELAYFDVYGKEITLEKTAKGKNMVYDLSLNTPFSKPVNV